MLFWMFAVLVFCTAAFGEELYRAEISAEYQRFDAGQDMKTVIYGLSGEVFFEPVTLGPGMHRFAITYTPDKNGSFVEYFLDGKRVSKVKNVGVPLDARGGKVHRHHPSLGPGEELRDKVNSVAMAHGLISLMDASPFQHPEAPELSMSVPLNERLFGQGARASYDNIIVAIEER